jgi:indole-3-glycerol phosphate synthase
MNILETIIEKKREEIAYKKKHDYLAGLDGTVFPELSLKAALLNSPTGIIAEFKRKSPSKGWIHPNADVVAIPAGYQNAGAAALSVLTDELFFGGSREDLLSARRNVSIPVLRKDFIIDSYQVNVAKGIGANAILLIAGAIDKSLSLELAHEARSLGMEVVLEIHDEDELAYIHPYVDIVGINNRNLKTFVTNVDSSFALTKMIPEGFVKISESGISDPSIVKQLREAGFNGFLIGEAFMKEDEPQLALKNFIEALK